MQVTTTNGVGTESMQNKQEKTIFVSLMRQREQIQLKQRERERESHSRTNHLRVRFQRVYNYPLAVATSIGRLKKSKLEKKKDRRNGNCDSENAFKIMKEWQLKSSGTRTTMNSTLLVQ